MPYRDYQQKSYPTVELVLNAIADWVNKYRHTIARNNELGQCGPDEVMRIANDLGVTPNQLREFVRKGPKAADLLPKMLIALHVDPKGHLGDGSHRRYRQIVRYGYLKRPVCTENLIRVDEVTEPPKLAPHRGDYAWTRIGSQFASINRNLAAIGDGFGIIILPAYLSAIGFDVPPRSQPFKRFLAIGQIFSIFFKGHFHGIPLTHLSECRLSDHFEIH